MTINHAHTADLPSSSLFARPLPRNEFPEQGMRPRDALDLIHLGLRTDGQPSMNLASFVTTSMEPEARQLIAEALHTNHIDHEEYPVADHVEQICVRMLAHLWNAPDVQQAVGVATIGSSEAIMLGLLAHKFRWREKRQAAGLPADKPNLVFGAETHIWDPRKSDRYDHTRNETQHRQLPCNRGDLPLWQLARRASRGAPRRPAPRR